MKTRKNKQLLNINTFLGSNDKSFINENVNLKTTELYNNKNNIHEQIEIENLNTIISNIIPHTYKIIKFLGKGIQGLLYLAIDSQNNRVICKKILLDNNKIDTTIQYNTSEQKNTNVTHKKSIEHKQLEFELNILKYLSNNATTRHYINPCIDYKILNNTIYTFFPIFNGYSLSHYKTYLSKLQHSQYYKLIFYLIKLILHGISNIHTAYIAHQNITENSILVSSNTKLDKLFIKFTDFGMGCGNSNTSKHMYIPIYKNDSYTNDIYNKEMSCSVNNNVPIKMTDRIKAQLTDSSYLQISQKYDLLSLGFIFIKLLLFFDNLDIDMSKGYDKTFIKTIKQYLINKYLPQNNQTKQTPQSSSMHVVNPLAHLKVSADIKRSINKYIKLFLKYIFCKTNDRQTCQYLLDKIIIYEKYKDDEIL